MSGSGRRAGVGGSVAGHDVLARGLLVLLPGTAGPACGARAGAAGRAAGAAPGRGLSGGRRDPAQASDPRGSGRPCTAGRGSLAPGVRVQAPLRGSGGAVGTCVRAVPCACPVPAAALREGVQGAARSQGLLGDLPQDFRHLGAHEVLSVHKETWGCWCFLSWDYVGEFLDNCSRVLVGCIHGSVVKEGLTKVLLVKVL